MWCVVIAAGMAIGIIAGRPIKARHAVTIALTCSILAGAILALSDIGFAKSERDAAEAKMWLPVTLPIASVIVAIPAVITAWATRHLRHKHRPIAAPEPPFPVANPGSGVDRKPHSPPAPSNGASP